MTGPVLFWQTIRMLIIQANRDIEILVSLLKRPSLKTFKGRTEMLQIVC